MLVVRNVLFILFAANGFGDPDDNLVLINSMILVLIQAFMWLPGKVYKVLTLNIFEAVFIMKLGISSAWTIFISHNNSDPVKGQMIAACTITTITIIIFMAIVSYHVWIAIKTSQFVKNVTRKPQRGVRQVKEAMLLRLPNIRLFPTPVWMSWESHCCSLIFVCVFLWLSFLRLTAPQV